MQGGKSSSAVGAAKEAVANVGASAWSGKEKTKAVVQETVNKVKAHDPAAKAGAEARKQDRIHEVEAVKQDAMRHNAAAKEHAAAATHHPTAAPEDRVIEVEGPAPVGAPAQTAAAPRAGSTDDGRLPPGAGHTVGTLHKRGTASGRSA